MTDWKLAKFSILLACCLAMFGCNAPAPVERNTTNNPAIQVSLLFVHEGVKVYRFSDGYRIVYYTDARGKTAWDESTGKTTFPMSVETVGYVCR